MTTLTRSDLAVIFGNNPKAIQAFETLQKAVSTGDQAQTAQAEATAALQDATVVVLSPNATFNNERVLAVGTGLTLTDSSGQIIIRLVNPAKVMGQGTLTLLTAGDTVLSLPQGGTVLTDPVSGPFADDAAAAAGGVSVDALYRKTGGTVAWRVS